MSHRTRLILHRALAMKANSDNDFDSDDSHVDLSYLPSCEEYISDDSHESLTDSRNKGTQKAKIRKHVEDSDISLKIRILDWDLALLATLILHSEYSVTLALLELSEATVYAVKTLEAINVEIAFGRSHSSFGDLQSTM
ncbi:hypothetical protein FQA39_LY03920 [Lamprigera yunnana]|nr:hypothetical protein FQA39_LY03920 [Lamprigera yunnana]